MIVFEHLIWKEFFDFLHHIHGQAVRTSYMVSTTPRMARPGTLNSARAGWSGLS